LIPIEPQSLDIDPQLVAGAKDSFRSAQLYEPVDHIPVLIDIGPECGESIQDVLLDRRAWFSSTVRRIRRSLRVLPDDYIPWTSPPWAAYFTIPVMLGAELWWEDEADSWPAIKEPPIVDVAHVYALSAPDPRQDGHAPEILARLEIAAACFPREVAIGGVDMMSPLGDVLALMDQTLFFVSLKRRPEAIHHACELVTRAQIALQEAAVSAVGGAHRFAAFSNWPIWRPEGARCLVTDDIASLIGPTVFREFDLPYTDRLMAWSGGGARHVCGPHPSSALYMREDPSCHGLNCSFRYTREQLGVLREDLGRRAEEQWGRRGYLEVMFERHMPLADMVAGFRDLAQALAPEVVAIPYCQVPADGTVDDDEITRFYWAMRAVGEEYAAKMRWCA
jgi:hypothetical protein